MRERERERVYKIGYKEKQSQSHLSYLDGFLWRIFLLLRADKLYLFLVLAWRYGFFLSGIFFFVFFYPEYLAFGSVHHEPCPTTNILIVYFRWREGVPTSFLGSQPIVWLLPSSFPCQATLGLLDVTPYRILYPSGHQVQTSVFPFWPGFVTLGLTYILSCLNGHSLTACHC